MAGRGRHHRFTVFDMLEAKGVFEANPANADSRDPETGEALYKGPVEYPKMFYHPRGEEKVVREKRWEPSPTGPVLIPEVRELIYQVANNRTEETSLRAAGWHDHPSKALVAAGKIAPEVSPAQVISSKDSEIERLREELAELRGQQARESALASGIDMPPAPRAPGPPSDLAKRLAG